MTNKEAIDHIKLILLRDRDNELHFVLHDEEIALDLAINALEKIESIQFNAYAINELLKEKKNDQ